jgi:hypothetical protein
VEVNKKKIEKGERVLDFITATITLTSPQCDLPHGFIKEYPLSSN